MAKVHPSLNPVNLGNSYIKAGTFLYHLNTVATPWSPDQDKIDKFIYSRVRRQLHAIGHEESERQETVQAAREQV